MNSKFIDGMTNSVDPCQTVRMHRLIQVAMFVEVRRYAFSLRDMRCIMSKPWKFGLFLWNHQVWTEQLKYVAQLFSVVSI